MAVKTGGKRTLGRPSSRSEHNIKIDLKQGGKLETRSRASEKEKMAGYCQHDNGITGFLKS